MRKNLPLLSFLLLSLASANAQEATTSNEESGYNRWSIELNGGITKPTTPFADSYYTERVSFFHADLGVRYMFNPKFGLKADVGYDKFENADDSPEFESQYYRVNLQGVANLGRILNFETWTNTLNLQFHTGVGYSQLKSDFFSGEDNMMNFIAGFTGQVRLSNRIALNGDFSIINNISQTQTFDGTQLNPDRRGFDATLYNASVGLTVYLGKNEQHADWYTDIQNDELKELEDRIGMIETGLADSDKDGVPDMYDLEPNSIAGVAVNTKGQSIDRNQNGVPDELENYLERTYGQNGQEAVSNTAIEDLINGGYVNVYFDFDSANPTKASLSGVDFLVKYMKANPSKTADIIGYADEIGNTEYNKALSQRRADAVKAIVISAGIDASRLNVTGNGEDTSVDKGSSQARQIVRRVTFQVK